ncbi:hypothetical protein JAAARDRAFT_195870 [Jaapia argillacea MUCL 33604]|uniref:Uncharacterized protein n=1 Tax=Jaapia argillacea MUCL 33604 TaxID=933084 RepID=A0A067PYS9_9AGAM|nr:hypothetical protein JAAARDRAFT_195870 [Jaapia argillacea MUCL 33604]
MECDFGFDYFDMDHDPLSSPPASSQLTGSQWVARARRGPEPPQGDFVKWQSSQTTCAALGALMVEAAQPSRIAPRVPDWDSSTSAFLSSASKPPSSSSTSTATRTRPRPAPRTRAADSSEAISASNSATSQAIRDPAHFLNIVKVVSHQIDENARKKKRRLEKVKEKGKGKGFELPKMVVGHSKPVSTSVGSEKVVKKVDHGVGLKTAGIEPKGKGVSRGMMRTISLDVVDVSDNDGDDLYMDVDTSMRVEPGASTSTHTGVNNPESFSVEQTSHRSSSFKTHSKIPVLPPEARVTQHSTSSVSMPPPPVPIKSKSVANHSPSSFDGDVSMTIEESPPIPRSLRPSPLPSTPQPPPITTTNLSNHLTNTTKPPQQLPTPSQPLTYSQTSFATNSRPPPLGMRRVHSNPYAGLTPSQQLPTKQRGFKPPLARAAPAPAPPRFTLMQVQVQDKPGRSKSTLPTPDTTPSPAGMRGGKTLPNFDVNLPPRVSAGDRPPSPAPADADSSYGDMSWDMEMEEAVRQYD